MMKNIYIKLIIVLTLFLFNLNSVFALSSESNNLEKIIINPMENDNLNINLYFSQDFNTKTYIQKIENGFYYVYLPDTKLKNNINIIYKNKFDKRIVKLKTEEKPFKSKQKDSRYTRIAVLMNSDYSLKLIPQNIKDYKLNIMEDFSINIYSLIFIGFCLILGLLSRKLAQIIKSNSKITSYTAFPASYSMPKISQNSYEAVRKNFKYNLEKSNSNQNDTAALQQNIKVADNSNFKCFNIPLLKENSSIQNEFNNVIKKTSEILKEKSKIIQNKLNSNPIENKNEQKNKGYEILSIIKLDKNRGFYLSKEKNAIFLYGFIGARTLPLRKFIDLPQINLQARFYGKNKKNDIFIVRVDSYKAMIEFSDTTIKELAVI